MWFLHPKEVNLKTKIIGLLVMKYLIAITVLPVNEGIYNNKIFRKKSADFSYSISQIIYTSWSEKAKLINSAGVLFNESFY